MPPSTFYRRRCSVSDASPTTIESDLMHELQLYIDAYELRSCGPRTFRPSRQRTRNSRFDGDIKPLSARRSGEEAMEETATAEETTDAPSDDLIDRATLCLPNFAKETIVHGGDDGFRDALRHYFPSAESNASERLVNLKNQLRTASTHDFWGILMEEMCDITGSQCGLVAKRMLVDDQDSAVEMPELGEPGSCLMGVAFYINNGSNVKELYRDYRYHAYGTPCAHMKHDKVFIVPERMKEVTPDNPNQMPWQQSEAFIGIPLFIDGKCFGHIGLVWSSEGASRRKLSWNFIEMFLHALEDMILHRILEGRGFVKDVVPVDPASANIIPLEAITASQSLKPYARSLSHELRTPMQGVVGMLDIMYSTVLDAIANQPSLRVKAVFEDLRSHIEVVQDSSRRAVAAADNVVHAYDLNMQMPETPLTPEELDFKKLISSSPSSRMQSPTRSFGVISSPRKRDRSEEPGYHPGPPLKKMFALTEADIIQSYYSEHPTGNPGVTSAPATTSEATIILPSSEMTGTFDKKQSPTLSPAILKPTHRRVTTRDFLRTLVNEALRSGHPTKEEHTETDLGETIQVRTLGPRGEVQDRTVYLEIESSVPEVIITEEQHLQFALQKLVDNAIKFTDCGTISITVRMGKHAQLVEIWVVDTGCGISEESKTNLFKPHFQEDASISRSRDGLGLSLFNAKAHVRKNLGGDVTLERSETEGPCKGSDFLIRLPISTLDTEAEVPLVGTPTTANQQRLFSPFPDPITISSSSSTNVPPEAAVTSKPRGWPSTPKPAPRKRKDFNSNLAKECPINVLIAEDNEINRKVAIGILGKLGYNRDNITVAFDGVEAVERYKASLLKPREQRFSAILMDIWMPRMDGYEATKKIMQIARDHGEKTTIIAVTADITEECLEKAKEVGMQGFLAKPYKTHDIERLIVDYAQKC